ncbi:MAG: hypothetical protein DWQ29_20475 [Planctomycetota bacterium]|nr:MAG: hypothetical protein DWQ29_20475 [Planctomycetota bacterium]
MGDRRSRIAAAGAPLRPRTGNDLPFGCIVRESSGAPDCRTSADDKWAGGEDVKHFTTVSRAIRRKQPLLRNEHRRPLAWSLRTLAACDNCNLRQFPATNNARYSVAIRRDVPGSSGLPDCSPTSRCGADWWFPREMIRAA